MWILDLELVLDSMTASRLPDQPVPQSPLRGRLTGTRGGRRLKPVTPVEIDDGPGGWVGFLTESTEDTEG
jgi:hypothetical protein